MLFALTLSMAIAGQDAAAPAFDRDARIAEAIAAVRPMAYRTNDVDWTMIEADMRRRTEGARDTVDMLPAYSALTYHLGDNHSFIQPTAEAMAGWRERHGERRLLPDTPPRPRPNSPFLSRTAVEGRDVQVGAKTARLVVVPPVYGSGEPARTYAGALFNAVADDGPKTCGYIVDVRGNTGGNVWPMLVGLSALSGDGPAGMSRDRDGQTSTYAELREGAAVITEAGDGFGMAMIRTDAWRPLPALAAAPVAVLTDGGVYSSGEGVAVHFKGRANTRFFGLRTGGLASSNDNTILSDGTNMVITVAMMMDRTGAVHPQGVEPDQVVENGEGSTDDPDDAVVEAARAWLATRPACSR